MLTQVPESMLDAATQTKLDTASSNATSALANAAAAQSTATAAGTAAAAKLSGDTLQVQFSSPGTTTSNTTQIPFDDTIPQITEGFEVLTATLTPASASNILEVVVVLDIAVSTNLSVTAALFQDATANALAAVSQYAANAGVMYTMKLVHRFAAGTTSPTTIRVRIGGNAAGTVYFNGNSGGRVLGGVCASSITVREIKA